MSRKLDLQDNNDGISMRVTIVAGCCIGLPSLTRGEMTSASGQACF